MIGDSQDKTLEGLYPFIVVSDVLFATILCVMIGCFLFLKTGRSVLGNIMHFGINYSGGLYESWI